MRDLEIVYQCTRVVEMVYSIAERERNTVTDTSRLEDLIFGRISRYVKGNKERLAHTQVIKRLAHQVAAQVKSEYKREHYELFDEFNAEKRKEGDDIAFEPEDVLTDVEAEVIIKETTDLLAQGDRIKKEIVGHWAIGNSNVASISRMLAHSFGGNEESHRKSITRFRRNCRQVLSAV